MSEREALGSQLGRGGQLSVHVSEMPAEGVELRGEVSFGDLDIAEDEVTRLPWPVTYRLHLSQVGEDLLVSGRLSAPVELMCDRCAEFSRHELSTEDVCHRYENVAGEVVDLTEGLREDILVVFPQTHLCSEDCAGLCPRCGANLNEGPCGCPEEPSASGTEDGEDGRENPFSVLDGLEL